MLTPVDLQQKKFSHGMGYAKKDVDAFFDKVVLSYTELYKSNADLTNQVKTLTDSLVHYRTTESKLQKSLMLAEKNAEKAFRAAHTLKGVCLNLGFTELYKVSAELTEVLRGRETAGSDELYAQVKEQYTSLTEAIRELAGN